MLTVPLLSAVRLSVSIPALSNPQCETEAQAGNTLRVFEQVFEISPRLPVLTGAQKCLTEYATAPQLWANLAQHRPPPR